MPELTWIGKEKVVNHHQAVPFRVLEQQYTYDADQSGNMIIHGDNLEALKSLLPRYEGKIRCIYIDPPYNTGNEGWVYNDNVNDPKIKKWLDEVVGKEGEDLSRHDKWLCMMYPRLKLLFSSNMKFLKLLKSRWRRWRSITNTRYKPAAYSDKKRQKKNRKGSVTLTVISDTNSVRWRFYFWFHGEK